MKCKVKRIGNKHDTMRRNEKCKIEEERKKQNKNLKKPIEAETDETN
jgi:hypothetical protein